MSLETPPGTRATEIDQRLAFSTFDALEKVIVLAVEDGEHGVAAKYRCAPAVSGSARRVPHRLEAARLGTGDREIAEEEDTIRRALEVVAQWSGDNDHRSSSGSAGSKRGPHYDDPGLGRCFGFVSQFDRSFELAESGATYDAAGDTWRKWRDGDKIRSQYKGPVNPDE